MELTKDNIGKTYFDPSLKGQEVIVNMSHWSPKPSSILTGNVEIRSNAGEPERMYEVEDFGYGQDSYVWQYLIIYKGNPLRFREFSAPGLEGW